MIEGHDGVDAVRKGRSRVQLENEFRSHCSANDKL